MSVGAFTAWAAVAVARQELTLIPTDCKERLAGFVDARVELARTRAELIERARAAHSEDTEYLRVLLTLVQSAVMRVEAAADVLQRDMRALG